MCQKRQRRCSDLLRLHEEAMQEWSRAETLEQVRATWARLGGKVTAHRYGRDHFRLLALHRHGDPEALVMLAARMQRRREPL